MTVPALTAALILAFIAGCASTSNDEEAATAESAAAEVATPEETSIEEASPHADLKSPSQMHVEGLEDKDEPATISVVVDITSSESGAVEVPSPPTYDDLKEAGVSWLNSSPEKYGYDVQFTVTGEDGNHDGIPDEATGEKDFTEVTAILDEFGRPDEFYRERTLLGDDAAPTVVDSFFAFWDTSDGGYLVLQWRDEFSAGNGETVRFTHMGARFESKIKAESSRAGKGHEHPSKFEDFELIELG